MGKKRAKRGTCIVCGSDIQIIIYRNSDYCCASCQNYHEGKITKKLYKAIMKDGILIRKDNYARS